MKRQQSESDVSRSFKATPPTLGEPCDECRGEGGFPTVEEAMRTGEQRQGCHACNGTGLKDGGKADLPPT